MATRVVEGKKPYTGGEAINIDENKVISLKLRDENNLIIYDSGDDEIYVDLQLPDGIEPLDAFPVGVTTGRVLVADDWDVTGTLICAKTTSGDNIKILYGDNGTLWIDNGTGTFKQIYLKSDTDALLLALRNYIDGELAKKQNGVASATAPSNPSIGDLWYDMSNDVLKVYDGSTWNSTGGGGGGGGGTDIEYVTQAEYEALLPGALTDNKHYFIYTADSPTPPSPWQPGTNTIAYYPLDSTNTVNDLSGNNYTLASSHTSPTFGTYQGVDCASFNGSNTELQTASVNPGAYGSNFTVSCWIYGDATGDRVPICNVYHNGSYYNWQIRAHPNWGSIFRVNITSGTDASFWISANAQAWHNLLFTASGSDITTYVDGVQVGTGTNTTWNNNGTFTIGCGWDENDSYFGWFSGGLSNVIIEDEVWTVQEIADYYNQIKANYGIS